MRAIVQRVKSASVSVDKAIIGEIEKGYFVLLGIAEDDNENKAKIIAEKISKLRVMADTEDKMNLNLSDTKGSILMVSQFTLYADTDKGNRPSFIHAAKPKKAEELYNYFVKNLIGLGHKVETGKFGAMMNIKAELDGPVTITYEL